MRVNKIHNGDLPKHFPNWHRLWTNFFSKENLVKDNEICKYEENWLHGFYIYSFDAWYLKSRCFDEMKSSPFTADDLREIIIALSSTQSGYNRETVNRINELIKLEHEAQHY